MDTQKIGELLRQLRRERGMTQAQLAERLHLSNKTVSKWERGMGCPDISLAAELSRILDVDMQSLLAGELNRNRLLGCSMRRLQLYVCPYCGNMLTSMTDMAVSCCGRTLRPLIPAKASETEKFSVQIMENSFFISSAHEMTKEHHIAFLALLTPDTAVIRKLYPEWDLQVRIPFLAHGRLLWYCTQHGLFCQNI